MTGYKRPRTSRSRPIFNRMSSYHDERGESRFHRTRAVRDATGGSVSQANGEQSDP